MSGSALFIQKLPLDILLIANDIAPLIKVFFTDFKESQKQDSLHNNLNLPCSNLIFVSNQICAFLHLKTFLCVQDVEHGILKSLKAINFISKNPMADFTLWSTTTPQLFPVLHSIDHFTKNVYPCHVTGQPSYFSCTNFITFMLTSPKILLLKINVKNKKVCDETKSPSLLLKGFAGFALQISYCA